MKTKLKKSKKKNKQIFKNFLESGINLEGRSILLFTANKTIKRCICSEICNKWGQIKKMRNKFKYLHHKRVPVVSHNQIDNFNINIVFVCIVVCSILARKD